MDAEWVAMDPVVQLVQDRFDVALPEQVGFAGVQVWEGGE
jgi:hypothetical protein